LILWSKCIGARADAKSTITVIIYGEIKIIYTSFSFCFKLFTILTVTRFSISYEITDLFYLVVF